MDAVTRVGRSAGALLVSTLDGVVATGQVACECETDLSAVHGRRPDGEDETPHESRTPSPCTSDRGHGTELAVEYGFMNERMADGRWFCVLTGIAQFTRECLCQVSDQSLTGEKVTKTLGLVVTRVVHRGPSLWTMGASLLVES